MFLLRFQIIPLVKLCNIVHNIGSAGVILNGNVYSCIENMHSPDKVADNRHLITACLFNIIQYNYCCHDDFLSISLPAVNVTYFSLPYAYYIYHMRTNFRGTYILRTPRT